MASWTGTLRSWLKAPRRKERRPRLEVLTLEERTTPVIGAFDVPFAADFNTAIGATNTTGIVDYHSVAAGGLGTGALLDVGSGVVGSRYVLMAAHLQPHAGDFVSFYHTQPDGTVKTIDIPVVSVWVNPLYDGNTAHGNDIAIATLAAVAPNYAADYPIYTGSAEVGKPYIMAGYGLSGTGTSGQADYDLQRMTITATGGMFHIRNPATGTQTAALPWNATPAQVQAALTAIGVNTQVSQPTVGPYTNSYEILFLTAGNARRLQFVSDAAQPLVNGSTFGTVTFMTLTNGQNDGEFQRLILNATGGTFRLGIGGTFTTNLPYNATDAQIQAAIETLPGVTEATVRKITTGPAAGEYQISFDATTATIPVLSVDTSTLTGTASAYILQNAGRRVLRIGQNEYDAVVGTTLRSDFDNDGTDDFEGQGDSGGAGFINLGGGQLAIASVVSYGGFVFGDTNFNTRVSLFTTQIQTQTLAPGYTLTLDMKYQLDGGDGQPDTIAVNQVGGQIQVWVNGILTYADAVANIASIRLLGSSDSDTFVLGSGITIPVTIDGVSGTDTIVGPDAPSVYTVTAANTGTLTTPTDTVNFSNISSLTGGAGNDSFVFQAGATLAGSIDGGGGANTLDLSATTTALAAQLTSNGAQAGMNGQFTSTTPPLTQFLNISTLNGSASATGDSLTGLSTASGWTQTGAGGVYSDQTTGRTMGYSNFETLNGGAGGNTFNILSTAGPMTLNGGAGNDTFDLASDAPVNAGVFALGGAMTINGGGGSDSMRVVGTAGDDAVTVQINSITDGTASNGSLLGLPQNITFTGLASLGYDGRGGSNSLTLEDHSDTTFGNVNDPASGIVFTPSGAASGTVRFGAAFQIAAASIGSLAVNGDADSSGNRDTLLVLGTSGSGRQSSYGETVLGNGQDIITVTDTAVSLQSVTGGPLLGINLGYNYGIASFQTLYVATGNETGAVGDRVTVTPSNRLNIVLDGMAPTARPGDQLTILANGAVNAVVENDPNLGPSQTRVTQTGDGASVGFLHFETGTVTDVSTGQSYPLGQVVSQTSGGFGSGLIAVGTDAGPETRVQVYDRLTGALRYPINPFPGFTGGASIAIGDVNGDGIPDLVVGAGPGGGPRVAVFSGLDGSLIYDFFAYEDTFRGGVNVAVADMNGDGYADIIIGTGVGGGPRVRVLSGKDLSVIRDTFVYEASFRGGVNVAAGDVTGDGVPDVVTSTGMGGGPRVVVLDGTNFRPVASFYVFDPNSRIGFTTTVGDVDGDGRADIIVGSGAGVPGEVRVFSGLNRALIADFFLNNPFDPSAGPVNAENTAVRVAAADLNGDGIDDVLVGRGPGSTSLIRGFQITTVNPQTNVLTRNLQEVFDLQAFDPDFLGGVFVGAAD